MVRWKTVMKAVRQKPAHQVRLWKGEDRDGSRRQRALDARNALALPFLCVLAITRGASMHTWANSISPVRHWRASPLHQPGGRYCIQCLGTVSTCKGIAGHLRHLWPVGCGGNNSLRANQQRRIDEDTVGVDANEPAV
jgi:hypothetical protein